MFYSQYLLSSAIAKALKLYRRKKFCFPRFSSLRKYYDVFGQIWIMLVFLFSFASNTIRFDWVCFRTRRFAWTSGPFIGMVSMHVEELITLYRFPRFTMTKYLDWFYRERLNLWWIPLEAFLDLGCYNVHWIMLCEVGMKIKGKIFKFPQR